MNLALLLPALMAGTAGFLLGMFLPGRVLGWAVLVLTQVAPSYVAKLPIKPTRLDRGASGFVILFHPVPLAIIAGLTVVYYDWPIRLGIAAESFWLAVLLGFSTNIILIVAMTAKVKKKRRELERSKLAAAAGEPGALVSCEAIGPTGQNPQDT